VAEGVEEKAQLAHFKTYKGIAAQGYLLGRPVPAEAATKLIAEGKPKLAFA
jgi:EAL domain-containing protein (putative c-di-GMP-specific phosphodiesterase class I)